MKINPLFPGDNQIDLPRAAMPADEGEELVQDELVELPEGEEGWPREVLLLIVFGSILALTILFN